MFSHSVGCLFVLFRVSFAVQKLSSLIKSHLLIFVFTVITLRGGSEKMLLSFMSESVWPMFSSKSFIASGLICRSFIHLELIFVYGVRECSNFILFHVAVQFSQHHLLNRLSFLHCIFLPPLS
uniref:Secreted protein n=1 Tax=Sus scrofa TaxID=9823 RepID=A0A8D1JGK2_PIG